MKKFGRGALLRSEGASTIQGPKPLPNACNAVMVRLGKDAKRHGLLRAITPLMGRKAS